MFHPDLAIIQNGSALSMTMMAGTILVYLFSFIFISFSIMSFMRKREKTLGLFIIMGASSKQIKRMIFRENMLIGLAAIIVALILGVMFAPLSLMLTQKVMLVKGFAMYFPIKAILLTFGMFFILFLLISFGSPYFIKKRKVIELVKSRKQSEKEAKYSTAFLLISSAAVGGSIAIMGYSNRLPIRSFVESSVGTFTLFCIFIVGLYVLFMQLYLLLINFFQRKKSYFRKVNMLTISGLKAKSRMNVKLMYLVTLLLTGAFFSIVMLYSANVNVKDTTKENIPYSFIYTSNSGNTAQGTHIKFLEQTLEKKEGYQPYKFQFLYNPNAREQAFISQKDYNTAVKGLHSSPIFLKKNEVYIINGLPNEKLNQDISSQTKNTFYKLNIEPKVIGISNQNILPGGYVRKLFVVSNEQFVKYTQLKLLQPVNVFAYNIDNWEKNTNIQAAEALAKKIGLSEQQSYGFFSQGDLYAVEKNTKNLMFYVGFMISLIFIIAAISIIYFQLITDMSSEREKYKGIIKMGLSKRELSKIISRQLFIVLFIPFTLASTFLFIGVGFLENLVGNSLTPISLICFGIFLSIQLVGYFMLKNKYVKILLRHI